MTQVETAPSNTLAPRRERIPVAVLGATGAVGQRFVQMLEAHPWFRLHEVVASERSAGKTYREAADWRLGTQMPRDAESMSVKELGAELDVLHVIAEPTRRRILDHVREHDRSVGELVELSGMHQPGVSRHLRVLRDAGLVDVRRDAQRRMYRLRAEPLAELDGWLEPYRAHLAGRLDALERHLERTSTPITPKAEEPR